MTDLSPKIVSYEFLRIAINELKELGVSPQVLTGKGKISLTPSDEIMEEIRDLSLDDASDRFIRSEATYFAASMHKKMRKRSGNPVFYTSPDSPYTSYEWLNRITPISTDRT